MCGCYITVWLTTGWFIIPILALVSAKNILNGSFTQIEMSSRSNESVL